MRRLVQVAVLFCSVLFCELGSARLAAQVPGGVKPAVGSTSPLPLRNELLPPSPSAAWPAHPAMSPMMNLPFQTSALPTDLLYPGLNNMPGDWRLGESATGGTAPEHGGFHDWPDPGIPQLGVHVHPYIREGQTAPEGWYLHTISGKQYWRLRGYLRPTPLPVGAPVDEAAFEITAPYLRVEGKPTVLVLNTPPTFPGEISGPGDGDAPDLGLKFGYAGWKYHNGLERNEPISPTNGSPQDDPAKFASNIILLQYNEDLRTSGALQYNVLSLRVMPVTVGRPTRFQMQRNLELIRAAQQMMTHPGPNSMWRPPVPSWQDLPSASEAPHTAVIEGGSLGGAVAIWTAIMFPNDFHGAASSGACPSIRSWVGEQEIYRYVRTLSGFVDSTHVFSPVEMLQYASALWGAAEARYGASNIPADWSPFFHCSSIRAWKDGFLKRPVYAIFSDEDYISMGVDSIPWLSGSQEYRAKGFATSSIGVPYFWSLSEKSCHNADQLPFEPPDNPSGTGWLAGPYDFPRAVLGFLHQAVASRLANPTVSVSVPSTPPNANLDVWDHVLQPATPLPPIPASPPALLKPGNFWGTPTPPGTANNGSLVSTVPVSARIAGKSFGSGTHLGTDDSSMVLVANQATHIYTGSAEGVVSRFVVDAQTTELVPMAISEPLGFGAWAMCRAQADATPQKEIVVGTERGLHILSYLDLTTLHSVRDLPWEQARPRAMKSVDVVPGGYEEILFISQNGCLAVYKMDPADGLKEYAVYGEPGVVDLCVLGTSEDHLVLALLSERGHVVKVDWDLGANTLQVLAVSPRLNEAPVDMEKGNLGAGDRLVVLMAGTKDSFQEEILVLDTVTMAHASPHRIPGLPANLGNEIYGKAMDLEIVEGSPGGATILVMRGGFVFEIPAGGAVSQVPLVEVSKFPPMMRPLDLVVHEYIAACSEATYPHEFVLTTEAGYVGWFSQDEFHGATWPDAMLFKGGIPRPTALNAAPPHCNRTTAATWGMDLNPATNTLELIDQAGTRWGMHGNGDLTYRHDTVWTSNNPLSLDPSPLPGPYRSLRRLPSLIASTLPQASVANVNPAGLGLTMGSQVSRVLTFPVTPFGPGVRVGAPANASWTSVPHECTLQDGFLPFPMAGDVLDLGGASAQVTGATMHAAWWGGQAWFRSLTSTVFSQPNWANRIQGLWIDDSSSPASIRSWWSCVGGVSVPTGIAQNVGGHDLRNLALANMPIEDAGALRLFLDPVSAQVRVAASTAGGRLFVLQAGADPMDVGGTPLTHDAAVSPPQVLDFGTGGTALATLARGGESDRVDIYFGVIAHYVGSTNFNATQSAGTPADDMVSAIAHVEYVGNASFGSAQLHLKQLLRLDGGAANRPKVFGVCGMTVGDIIPSSAGEEIVVGSLDGHLLVYERLSNGDFGSLVYKAQVGGAVGMHNGLVVADLDTSVLGNELYTACSLGVRKWTR
ncbi:MAG: hypothetical protein ABL997_09255 [Planctomycetota bacterium]